MKKLELILVLVFPMMAFASGWDANNSPYKLDAKFHAKFRDLPKQGALKDQRMGWPGSHWANYVGGIANRWSAANPQNFKYKMYTRKELEQLGENELDELSPAEKYDIYKGDYNYSTVKKVYQSVSPTENRWHGICHGYAPAALNHPEPGTSYLTNPDGIKVYFYSSDVAALMSYYYAKVFTNSASLIGTRCNYNPENVPPARLDACNDLNAGAFHIVVANKLGEQGVGFVSDIDRYFEVWNHVAVGYQTTVLGGTNKRIHVKTIVSYAGEIAPKFDPVLNTENAVFFDHTYEYFLELNSDGVIIGGDWISELRPDFVWTQKKADFKGEWTSLNQIYHPAVR